MPARLSPSWSNALGYGSLVLAAVLAAVLFGRPAIFSAFTSADEGGFLVALDLMLSGRALYDDLFFQYGPSYLALMGPVLSLPGVDVSHDAARTITLGLWTGASLLCGAALYRLTSNLAVALSGLLVAFYALSAMVYEPLHPGGTLAVLLAGIAATAAFALPSRPRFAFFAIGVLAVTAALIKVNVGLFALAAIAFACATAMSPRRSPLRIAAAAMVALLPFALMHDGLSEGWVREYALVVALGAGAVAVAAAPLPDGLDRGLLRWIVLGGAIAAAAGIGAALIGGTTPGGFVDGIVVRPLRHADLFLTELDMLALAPLWALLGLLAAAYATRGSSARLGAAVPLPWLVPVLRLAAGMAIWIAVLRTGGADPALSAFRHDFNSDSIALAAPLAWVAAIPPREGELGASGAFVRALVPMLAVLQLLHPYPIPGTQVVWGLFLFAVVGGICAADGVRDLRPLLAPRGLRPAGDAIVLALLGVFLIFPFADWGTTVRDSYAAERPLDLPGAHRLRLPEQQAAEFRDLTAAIRRSCSSFVTLPGIESLYLFTETDPPATMSSPPWPSLFETGEQQEIVDEVEDREGLCAVRNTGAAEFLFSLNPDFEQRPLVRFIEDEFTPTQSFGPFELMQRNDASG